MSTPNPKQIFISYAHKDGEAYANQLVKDLERLGYDVWIDRERLTQNDFSSQIEQAIKSSSYVAICLTPEVNEREDSFVRREAAYALRRKKQTIPLLFPNAEPILILETLPFVAFNNGNPPENYQRGLEELIKRLKQANYEVMNAPHDDPHSTYLDALYEQINDFLDTSITRPMMTIVSRETQDAVIASPKQYADLSKQMPRSFIREERTFPNFEKAYDHYKRRVLLLGVPGSGKTTTLFAFARDIINKRFSDPSVPLPIFMNISSFNFDSYQTLAEWIKSSEAFAEFDIEVMIEREEVLLLLDGLDELAKDDQEFGTEIRQRFMALIPATTSVVVTCRIHDYYAIGEKLRLQGAVTLQPLSDKQLAEYFKDFPELWQLLNRHTPLRQLARTPLIANLLASGFMNNDQAYIDDLKNIPENTLQHYIIGTYIENRYRQEALSAHVPLNFSYDELVDVLGQLAVQNVQDPQGANIFSLEDLSGVLLTNRLQDFAQFVTKLGFMIYKDTEGQHLGFTHLFVRDYFYTEWVERLDGISLAKTFFEAFNWWGRYVEFPFCRNLLILWHDHQEEHTDDSIYQVILEFVETYPVGSLAEKATHPHWDTLRTTLERLFIALDITYPFDTLAEDKLDIAIAVSEFLAESYRFANPPQYDHAESIYRNSIRLLQNNQDDWNACYQYSFIADMLVSIGEYDKSLEVVEQAITIIKRYAEQDDELDTKEIMSLCASAQARAYYELKSYEKAGIAFAQSTFWSYQQLVEPGPPDTYYIKWYADMCLECVKFIQKAQKHLSPEAFIQFITPLYAVWQPQKPISELRQLASEPVVIHSLFKPNAQTTDIGTLNTHFAKDALAFIQSIKALDWLR